MATDDQDQDQRLAAVTETFTVNDLGRVRGLVERACRAVGLAAASTTDFVVAVNEILINAVKHAGGGGRVTVEPSAAGVWVEVSDNGPGVPTDLPTKRPEPHAEGGRGLWMARRLCQQFTVSNGPRGATVRMFVAAG